MTPFETLEAKVESMNQRILVLEAQQQRLLASSADDLEAQREAQRLGFSVTVVQAAGNLPGGNAQKKAMAKELRAKGWSADRIGRALKVTGRTIERWLTANEREGRE